MTRSVALCLSFLLLATTASSMPAQQPDAKSVNRFAIILHGGAGGEPKEWNEEYRCRAAKESQLGAGCRSETAQQWR